MATQTPSKKMFDNIQDLPPQFYPTQIGLQILSYGRQYQFCKMNTLNLLCSNIRPQKHVHALFMMTQKSVIQLFHAPVAKILT